MSHAAALDYPSPQDVFVIGRNITLCYPSAAYAVLALPFAVAIAKRHDDSFMDNIRYA
jgi:hypothetical protein